MRRLPLLAGALLGACHSAPMPARTETHAANERLPALVLHHVSTTIDNSPRLLEGGFVVGPQGLLFNHDDRGDGFLYSVLDSTGSLVRRVGKTGDGPGEIRREVVVDVSDSGFIVSGISSGRLARFTLDGVLRASSQLRELAAARVAVSGDELLGGRPQREGTIPVIVTISTGAVRPLMTGTDSFMTTFPHPDGLLPDGSVKIPVLGRWAGGFIAADGFEYRLALYAWDGTLQRILHRELPAPHLSAARLERVLQTDLSYLKARRTMAAADVARLRDDLASRRQPFFPHNRDSQIGMDGEGRIWVVGIDADSGFADVFSSTTFLGRLPLPCPGFEQGWSLKGSWFVAACKPEDPDFDGDAVFKVFRIKG